MLATVAFWCAAAGLFAAAQLLPPERLRLRAGAIAALSAAGIVAVFKMQPLQYLLVAASIAWLLVSLRLVRPDPRRGTVGAAILLIAPVLALWTVGKIATAANQPLAWLYFVGASFLLVKAFSLIKDRLEGKLEVVDPAVGAAYFLFLPTYFSGPMHTYGEFHDTLANPREARGEFIDIAFRFVWGLFKVSVLATILDPGSLTALIHAESIGWAELLRAALFYSGVIYLNFSGYSDMVIAVSRGMGVRTPENFDWPYLAPSIRDFWRRWHITFSRALTAHVFMPVSRALSRVLPGRRFLVPGIGYFATFIFAGFWHGATPNFLLWGAWHAFGLIVQDFAQKLRPPRVNTAHGRTSWPLRILKTAATFAFVTVGWIFFVLPVEQLTRIR